MINTGRKKNSGRHKKITGVCACKYFSKIILNFFFLTLFQQPPDLIEDVHDVDVFEVDLMKDSHGLGITIAGYVGGDNAPGQSRHLLLPLPWGFYELAHDVYGFCS